MKNFFRKVAYGIGPNEDVPSDPLKWALDQLNDVPELSWQGKIYTEKELRGHYRDWVYGDRKVLRKKYKDNKTLYKTHKNILRHKTGQKFWESLEIEFSLLELKTKKRLQSNFLSSMPRFTKLKLWRLPMSQSQF